MLLVCLATKKWSRAYGGLVVVAFFFALRNSHLHEELDKDCKYRVLRLAWIVAHGHPEVGGLAS